MPLTIDRWLLLTVVLVASAGLLAPHHGSHCPPVDAAVVAPVFVWSGDGPADLKRARKESPVAVLDALEQLVGTAEPKVVAQVLDLLDDGLVAWRPAARTLLGSVTGAAAQQAVVDDGLGHRRPHVRAHVILALGQTRPTGVDWVPLALQGLAHRDAEVRAAAVWAAGRVRATDKLPLLLELVTDRAPLVRAQLPACLVRLVGARCLPALDELADDPRWRVRLAVIDAWRELPGRETAERLVERMHHEDGRLREDIHTQLVALTGQSYGLSVAAWRRFLASVPDDFFDHPPSARGVVTGLRYEGGGGLRSYHRTVSASNRFLMLTDCSGSMDGVCPVENASHMAGAQDGLRQIIESLDDSVTFNLIRFSDRARRFRPRPLSASAADRKKALAEVRQYTGNGSTNLWDGLRMAFDTAVAPLMSTTWTGSSKEDVDTLFLLTDGAPSSGDITNLRLLTAYVAERNRTARLRIHGVSFAHGQGGGWLRQVVESTGGQYDGGLE